jgi:hypothetical protein
MEGGGDKVDVGWCGSKLPLGVSMQGGTLQDTDKGRLQLWATPMHAMRLVQ